MGTTKLKLDSISAFDSFFSDTHLLGIISSQKGYQICWRINQTLDFDFRLDSENELEMSIQKKGKHCFFQIYDCYEPINYTKHYIYSNHFKGEFLVPELKHIDYLWLIKGDFYEEKEIKVLMKDLRQMNNIQMVTPINAYSLRSKSNLII